MNPVEVSHISKSFGSTQAVRDVSFEVAQGEIFGLLGPNGAGKTTTIRVMLDIFKPDSGTVSMLGGHINEEKKDPIDYMPEERGLYQDITLERCLVYLGTLKGLSANDARNRLQDHPSPQIVTIPPDARDKGLPACYNRIHKRKVRFFSLFPL